MSEQEHENGTAARRRREALVIALPEQWPAGGGTPWHQVDLLAALARTARRLVLDLNELRTFDGETAAVLVELHRLIAFEGADVRLAASREEPAAEMALARLRRLYGVHPTADDAVASLAAAA